MSANETVHLPSVAILGTGSMGQAILTGLLQPGVSADGITVTNRSVEKAEALAALPGVTSLATSTQADANQAAAASADIVLIGVKPGMVTDLLAHIGPSLKDGAVVVSIAAGVSIASFEAALPAGTAVVRSMPNTPAGVGLGVTGVSRGTAVSDEQLAIVEALFGTVGEVIVVPESQIDALSTISGSGPAYVYYLIEQLSRTAVGMGFTAEEAHRMVVGTFLGASTLAARSPEDPAELRRRVTSPAGTTERAIAVLQDAGFEAIFDKATAAALARAKELAAGA